MSITTKLDFITSSDSSISSSSSPITQLEKSTNGMANFIIKDLSLEESFEGLDVHEWAIMEEGIEEEGIDSDDEFDPYLEGVDNVIVGDIELSPEQFLSSSTTQIKQQVALIRGAFMTEPKKDVAKFVENFLRSSDEVKKLVIENITLIQEAFTMEPKKNVARYTANFFRLSVTEREQKIEGIKDRIESSKENAALTKKLLPKISRITEFLKADIADGEIKSLNELFGEKGLIMDMTTGEPQF